MIVKVGDVMYSSDEQPVMVIVNQAEKDEIGALPEDQTLYAKFPARLDSDRVRLWMLGALAAAEIDATGLN